MTQAEKNRIERPLDEWAINAALSERQIRYQKRKAERQERKKRLEERNEALQNMLRRK